MTSLNLVSTVKKIVYQNHILGFVPGLYYKVRSVWKGDIECWNLSLKKCLLQYFRIWKLAEALPHTSQPTTKAKHVIDI